MVLLVMGLPVVDQKLCAESRYSSVELETKVRLVLVSKGQNLAPLICLFRAGKALNSAASPPQNAKTKSKRHPRAAFVAPPTRIDHGHSSKLSPFLENPLQKSHTSQLSPKANDINHTVQQGEKKKNNGRRKQ